jgi:NADPH:quinone reductase-like Zn-dependent oxidoreductase
MRRVAGAVYSGMPRRLIYRRHGDVDVLELESFPMPRPGPGELRVSVAYAGVNYADVIARRGFYKWAPPLPTCVGFEVSGTVAELGAGVSGFAVGDRVVAITRFGGYADELVIEARRAFPVPPGKSLAEAAAIPAVHVTAWRALCEVARVRRGESVLIQAVAGGVGLAALQMAKQLGLVTYGTASSDEKLAFARGHGLDHAINYAERDFEAEVMALTYGRGVDCVLDSLGGAGLRKGYRCLARGGLVVTIGAAQVAPAQRGALSLLKSGLELLRGGVFHPFQLIEDNRGIAGVQVLLLWDDLESLERGMGQILSWWQEGALRPHVDRVFPLEAAREAHAYLESRRSRGKLLLSCAGADA